MTRSFKLAYLLALIHVAAQVESTFALAPLVDTGVSELSPDGKHVAVNVPAFFTMTFDTRGPFKGLRMSQSILSGLVKVDLNRKLGEDKRFHGPIKVEVAGMTMYDNREPAPKD